MLQGRLTQQHLQQQLQQQNGSYLNVYENIEDPVPSQGGFVA